MNALAEVLLHVHWQRGGLSRRDLWLHAFASAAMVSTSVHTVGCLMYKLS